MINISKSNFKKPFGKLLRLPLKIIPSSTVLPIMQGSLKGKKWIKGSSINGCWLGTYELDKQLLFKQYIKPGMVIYDVGANAGFYTLLSSVLSGETGKVFAFEPVPMNIKFIMKHIELNRLGNVEVIRKAVSDKTGKLKFSIGKNNSVGHLSNDGELEVETITLDDFTKHVYSIPDLIKMDIEGAEYDALKGAKEILSTKKPVIFLATHSNNVKEKCIGLLKEFDYKIKPINEQTIQMADEFICE